MEREFVRKRKLKFAFVVFALVFSILQILISVSFASPNWWDSDWQFRQEIILRTNSGTTPSDYQVNLKLNSSRVGSNFNWSNNCDDIRFVNSTLSELKYYVESCDFSNQNASVWIKIPVNLTTSNYSVYMYYANNLASSNSNPTNTFDFYDDFSGNLSKWTLRKNVGNIYIQTGYLHVGGGTTSAPYGHAVIGSGATYNGFRDGIIEGQLYLFTNAISEVGFRGIFASNQGYKSRIDARAGQGLSHLKPPYNDGSWAFLGSCSVTGTGISTLSWHNFNITSVGSSFTIRVGSSLTKTCSDTQYTAAGEISLQNHYGTYTRYDNIRVRKYFANNIISSFGLEEEYIIPEFYNFSDNSGKLFNLGSGKFYVNVNNTNGTVILNIDGNYIYANNTFGNLYYAVYNFTLSGNYSYNWFSYGNQSYVVNSSSNSFNYSVIEIIPPFVKFIYPTPISNSNTYNRSFIFNLSVDKSSNYNVSDISKILFIWNLDSFSVYDKNVSLLLNLNNNSKIGESLGVAKDVSLNNHSGIFIGNLLFSDFGKYGGSILFDGTDDWLEVADDSSFSFNKYMTFEAWVYDTSNDALPRALISKRTDQTSNLAFSVFKYTNKYLFFDIGPTTNRHSTSIAIPRNEWVHIVVTFDGTKISTQRKKFYYNGNLVATTASTLDYIPVSTEDITIGVMNKNYGDSWMGYMDEIKLINRTLSDEEIKFNYISNLNKFNNSNWNFVLNKTNLDFGSYNYSACGYDILGNVNCTGNRNLTVLGTDLNVSIISPINLSKVFNNGFVQLDYNVSGGFGPYNCSFYVDGILNKTVLCNLGINYENISLKNSGLHKFKINVSDSTFNSSISNEVFVNIIFEYGVSVSKQIKFENTNMYKIGNVIKNLVDRKIYYFVVEFINNLFSYGSFSPNYNISQITTEGDYLIWNRSLENIGDIENINYSISGIGSSYSSGENYIIGLD